MYGNNFFEEELYSLSVTLVDSKTEYKPSEFNEAEASYGLHLYICAESTPDFDVRKGRAVVNINYDSICFIKGPSGTTSFSPRKNTEMEILSFLKIDGLGSHEYDLYKENLKKLAPHFDTQLGDHVRDRNNSQAVAFYKAAKDTLEPIQEEEVEEETVTVNNSKYFKVIIQKAYTQDLGPFLDAEDFINKLNLMMDKHSIKKYFNHQLPSLEDIKDGNKLELCIEKTEQTMSAMWGDYAIKMMEIGIHNYSQEDVDEIVANIEGEGFDGIAIEKIVRKITTPLQEMAVDIAECRAQGIIVNGI